MDNQPVTNPPGSPRVRLWPWLIVLFVLLLVAFIRFRLLDMPLERDEGEYAYTGQLLLQGIPPYQLAYNMKLPGTYFAYALGMAVFGQTIAGVHLTLMVANGLTIIFVFLLGRKLFDTTTGLVAGATFGILSVSPAVLGMAAHANHFVILFAVPATWLLWRAEESKWQGTLFVSGLLFGLAFLMKQQGICFCLFGCGFLAWQELRKGTPDWPGFGKRFFSLAGGMLLPFTMTCFFLALAGVFSRFWFWTFTYAGNYATHETLGEGIQNLYIYFQIRGKWELYFGFLILIAAGLALAIRRKAIQSQMIFCSGFLGFSFLGSAIGLYFRTHYFILLLPAFAIMVGLAVGYLRQVLRSTLTKSVPLILFAVVLGWNLFLQRGYFFQLPALQVCRLVYGANPFIESLAVAKYIQAHSSESALVAVVGSEPQIYFYANRHSATGYIYTYALMEQQSYAAEMQREMIREIESNQPEYIVLVRNRVSWLLKPSSDQTILIWADKYSGQFYEMVGIASARSNGETDYYWGEQAKNHYDPLGQCLIIYKRKSGETN
jgi:4-amino-4-deoxy-L-arabinose transferase-like glycosyltransferase